MRAEAPSKLPAFLFIAGLALIMIGMALFLLTPFMAEGTVSGGGVIFIGPLPIAFGVGEGWPLLVALALFSILLLMIIVMLSRPLKL